LKVFNVAITSSVIKVAECAMPLKCLLFDIFHFLKFNLLFFESLY
jgi:hypothetical protein